MSITFNLYRNANLSNRLDGAYPNGDAPAVLGVSNVAVGATTVTITGGGFGTKPQAAPTLSVYGSEIYENGVINSSESAIAEGSNLSVSDVWGLATSTVLIDKTVSRDANIDQIYKMSGAAGAESIVGWPNVMLSTDGNKESSLYNDKLYTSFYTKFTEAPFYYRAVAVTDVTGTFSTGVDEFDEGEAILFNGLTGKVLHYDSVGGILHLVVDVSGSSADFNGTTITGLTSGATCTAQSGTLYSNPGATKIFRAFENTSGDAIRTAFSATGCVVGGYSGYTESYRVKTSDTMRPSSWKNWHQVEFYADNSGATGSGYIKQADDKFSWSDFNLTQKSLTNGLTPSNIGFDLSGVHTNVYIKQWVSELYVDTTPQRIVIGDNSDFTLCTKFDHLIPESWSDSQVVAKKRNLSGWLYVVGADNNPINTTGYGVTI